MNITIDNELKEKCPDLVLGCIFADVSVKASSSELLNEIDTHLDEFIKNNEKIVLSTLPQIKAGRGVYRALGKDPTKYRISSEALARRILKGKGLYQINNVVDINNLMSIKTLNPICSYDISKLKGDIIMTYKNEIKDYEGIGRGQLNVSKMPILIDDIGIFGSCTSDSERAKITSETKRLFLKIVSFQGVLNLTEQLEETKKYLEEFCMASNIEIKIIE